LSVLSLRLVRFRNYPKLEVGLHPRLNLFLGANAQGKTNILEALYCLSTTRSFRSAADDELIAFGQDEAAVEAEVEHPAGREVLRLEYYRHQGKGLSLDGKKQKKLSSLLGRLPSVVFSPDDLFLVKGAPVLRRRLLDVTLLQMDPVYLVHLQQYERSLKQRNALLKSRASGLESQLPVWDEALARHGAFLQKRRGELAAELSDRSGRALEDLTGGAERFEAAYAPQVKAGADEDSIRSAILEALRAGRRDEMVRGTTLNGPHRDDVRLSVNGKPLRKYGSQGQMRTGALAVKLAQLEILAGACRVPPLVLFDDVMAELDEKRQAFFLERLKRGGQALLTGTSENDFAAARGGARVFRVAEGAVTMVDAGPPVSARVAAQ